jgi:hypothetical protein
MLSIVDRHVIARERNVVRVDFRRDPDPPSPYFPGALGARLSHPKRDEGDTPKAFAKWVEARDASMAAWADEVISRGR